MNSPGRLLIGIALLVAGVLFLLDLGDIVDAGSVIATWWPVVLIAFGLVALVGPARSLIGGTIVTGIGVILLVATLDLLPVSAGELILPLILIGVGLALVLLRTGIASRGSAENTVSGFAMFGGQNIVARSDKFSGGTLTALFGGIDFDLRQAHIAPGGAGIEVFTAFGGVNVIVPRGMRVTVSGMPLFGAVEDKVDRSAQPEPDAPAVNVTGIAMFGGIEVKHENG